MTRAQRIQLVIGLSTVLGGVLIAGFGSVAVAMLSMPDMSILVDEDSFVEHAQAIHRMSNHSNIVFAVGVGFVVAGAVFSLVLVVKWFIGAPEQDQTHQQSAAH